MNTPKYTIKNITKILAVVTWKNKENTSSDLDIAMDFINDTGIRAVPKVYFGHESTIGAQYLGDKKGSEKDEYGYVKESIALNLDVIPTNVKKVFISITNNDKEQVFSSLEDVKVQLLEANSKDVVYEINLKENEITQSASAVVPFSFEIEAGSIVVSESPFVAENTYLEDVHAQYFSELA